MRYLKTFEGITVDEFNKDLDDEWEENEPEEDDDIHIDKISDLKGGKIYRAVINVKLLDKNNGKIYSFNVGQIQNYSNYWDWSYWWNSQQRNNIHKPSLPSNRILYDIYLEIKELTIDVKATKPGYLILSENGKNKYSFKVSTLIQKHKKLHSYYVRPNDVIAFNMSGLKKGLRMFTEKNGKVRFLCGIKTGNGSLSTDIVKIENQLENYKKREKSINKLIDIYDDDFSNYLDISKLKYDLTNTKNRLTALNSYKPKIDDIKEYLLKKIDEL